jgi:curli biogenesis system outer membrane secretion channel CsgG
VAGMLALSPVLTSAQSKIEISEVTVTGYGTSPAAATLDALDSAVAQVTGTRIASDTSNDMRQELKDGKSTVSENFKQSISKLTKGIVKSYQLIDQSKDPKSGQVAVKITAQVPRYEQSPQLKRLRLAVMPISIVRSLATDPDAVQFSERISAGTEAYLTQTRRFGMLDRRNGNAVDKELDFIRSAEMPVEELVRTTAAVGTDYLVLTTLKDFSATVETVMRPNGREMERLSIPVTVDVRVIDVATRQIKFASTFHHRGRLVTGKTLQTHATDVAQALGETILNAIYPIAVIAAEGNTMTLNQGGVTVKAGRKYKLVQLGAPMIDPYTKESLGRQETDVGLVEITSVTAQMSSAKLLVGSTDVLAAGDLLVRPRSAEEVQAEAVATEAVAEETKKKSKDSDW